MEVKIKTALEKALERAASLKEVPREEVEKMEYMPRGRTIAASFMNNRHFNINEALSQIEAGTEKYVLEGLQEVLLMNISLPLDESADDHNRRAMEGVLAIKRDKSQAAEILGEMEQLLGYYRQAMDQTKERFKQEYEARGRSRKQGPRGREQDGVQDFREEWSSVVKQLNTKFETGLAEIKGRIRSTH
ncbi:MAG: hypothetical protein VR68_13890 [Peptococcaceae bacterium BRH_c4a]|nr:MAG: hypothetical protein VR68_13890 [Peptococcaceae bacterium BRH_c4a]